jgi:hypothetical protein
MNTAGASGISSERSFKYTRCRLNAGSAEADVCDAGDWAMSKLSGVI